ncbi:tRNA pseudouridine(55) synthase TruB [Denitratisoma oestradiolicum]|uniref:tRNA pseudouridine synthase B n=1 Tax=Denitratisoma oestradiolicum TaxID=311182 RepID=A0A6S6Y0I4_9PROT|nr:tRNA pseudouridine(55) synthase TruB [Denitratisoma oestradiolicum]TWO81479.1 tRNA pseudouridine(55) synthase TruB [Denitratisoma oestradiolicum]CAB1368689.1 tRNA pseudouridine synthase [Denitratisoma oestradiolicum]
MSAPRRAPRRPVDGVLLLDKPTGLTSNAALQKARWLLNAAKAGHTGTLDPLATGLLPLCFGEATKFAGELLDADKAYRATIRLGVTTDTADAEGHVLETRPVEVDQARLEAVLASFRGGIEQIPPMHSALKRDGKPLYEYARQGIELERKPRRITIHALELLSLEGELAVIDVACSKGTYVRTLAADIGALLGCGAHLAALRRTRIGGLRVEDAVALDVFEALTLEARDRCLAPPDTLLAELPVATLNAAETERVLHGQGVRWEGRSGDRWRYYGINGAFLGLGELSTDGWLNPRRLIASRPEISGSI